MVDTIKIYGKESSKYYYFKHHLNNHLAKYGMNISVQEVNDLDEIIASGVEAIPAIKIKNSPMMVCYPQQNINDFLKESIEKIIQVYKSNLMKRILFPTDLSEASKRAFMYAKKMAVKMNATITVVNYYKPNLDISPATHQDEIAKRMDDFLDKDDRNKDSLFDFIHLDREYLLGFAGEEIINRSEEFDLIIMATSRGLHGTKKWFGSVSQNVARNAECPVILLPPGEVFEFSKNVLYPLKERMEGFDSLEWLFEKIEPTLHLVHFDTEEIHSPMIKEMMGEHSDLLSPENPWNVLYENKKCDEGQLEVCLADYINEKEIDLLVLEKGKEHFLEFLIHKSISEKMLDRIEVPVIVLHSDLLEGKDDQIKNEEIEKAN